MRTTQDIHRYFNKEISKIDCNLTQHTYMKSIEPLTYEDIKYIGEFEPETGNGFLYTKNKNITDIMEKMNNNYNGHSGASLAITLNWIKLMYLNFISNS